MNKPSPLKVVHVLAIAAGVLLVGVFFWSTLGTFAFNGPTQTPPSGSGGVTTDASNNVTIGGNLTVSGTISAVGLGGSTIDAADISSGEFGSSTGGGGFEFPNSLIIGDGSDAPLIVFSITGFSEDADFGLSGSPSGILPGDNTGDFDFDSAQNINLAAGPSNTIDLTVATSGNVGIGTTTIPYLLTVNGTTSAAAYCISGANCITAWPGGSSGANPSALIGTSAVNGSASTFMRSDGAPAIDQTAAFSFSALGNTTSTANVSAASMNITGGAQTASTITAPTTIGKCASTTVTITGATSSTGAVFVSPLTYPGNGYTWQGYVSALNTVVVEECAATTTSGSAVKFNAIYIR